MTFIEKFEEKKIFYVVTFVKSRYASGGRHKFSKVHYIVTFTE